MENAAAAPACFLKEISGPLVIKRQINAAFVCPKLNINFDQRCDIASAGRFLVVIPVEHRTKLGERGPLLLLAASVAFNTFQGMINNASYDIDGLNKLIEAGGAIGIDPTLVTCQVTERTKSFLDKLSILNDTTVCDFLLTGQFFVGNGYTEGTYREAIRGRRKAVMKWMRNHSVFSHVKINEQ